MEGFLGGLAILVDPWVMLMVFLGTVLGIFVGALPGISGSTTIALMRASSVSLPMRVARTIMRPLLLIAAPITREPGPTSTGVDSPVIIELLTDETPEITSPSVAIRAPGLTTKSSPIANSEIGIITSKPFLRTVTSLAPSASKVERELLARCLARDSR